MLEKNKINVINSEKSNEIDLGRLLVTMIDHQWLIIGITTFFAVVGIIYSIFATPIYRADALVQVEQNVGSSLLNNLSQMLPNSQPESAAEVELIKSRMVVGKTIHELNLDTSVGEAYFPFFGKGFSRLRGEAPAKIAISRLNVPTSLYDEPMQLEVIDKNSYQLTTNTGISIEGKVGKVLEAHKITLLISEIDAEPGVKFNIMKRPEISVVNDILENFNVADKGKDTGVLGLSLLGENPDEVVTILNKITQNYLLQNIDRKSEEAAKSLVFLKEQLPLIRSALDGSEDKLNAFRQKNDSVDLSLEAKSVLDTMVSVETQLNELTFKEAEISKLYTKEHPSYRALMEKRKTLEEEKEKLNRRVSKMPKTQQEILRLTRDVQSGQEVYMQLLNKQQELSISKASTVGNVRIIDSAVAKIKPVQPNKVMITVLFTVFGGLISVCFVMAKTYLHKGIESPQELEEVGINVYSSIPVSEWQLKKDREFVTKNKHGKINARANELLAVGNPADLAIEAIRGLRTSLHFAMMEAKNNILMLSGASPSIGKTFVSVNLAAVIAQAGSRVLVIDADMRKGYAHQLLGVSCDKGISDVLSDQATVDEVVSKTSVDNLDFISRGQVPPNPSELLMRSRLSELLAWATENYDLVLIDTPPILAVTDAAIIGHHAGAVLMVARFEANTVKEVEVSIHRLEQNGVEIKGVILNAVVQRASGYYGYANYGYYNYEYKSDKN
ncbi:tyrosine-protein kinase Wzc [Serratia sp. D1N4]